MTKRCIICYGVNTVRASNPRNSNNVEEDTLQNRESPLTRFLQLLERYLDGFGEPSEESRSPTRLSKLLLQQLLNSGIGSCEGCSKDLESFIELYHHMKSVQLLLNWRLKRITDLMIDAEAKPFRREEFRKFDKILKRRGDVDGHSSEEVMKGILEYRKQLINKSTRMLQNDFPKLIVQKCQAERGTTSKPKTLSQADLIPPQIKIESHDSDMAWMNADMEMEVQSSSISCQDDFSDSVTSPLNRTDTAFPTTSHCIPSDENRSDSFSGNKSKLSGSEPTSTGYDDEDASGTPPITPSDESSGSDSEYLNADDEEEVDGTSEIQQDNTASGSISRVPRRHTKTRGNFRKVANKKIIVVSKQNKKCKKPTKKPNDSFTTKIVVKRARNHLTGNVRRSTSYQEKFKATMGLENFKCQVLNCPRASKPLCIPSDFEAHQKYHGDFNCSFCTETFNYAMDLALHELAKHSDKNFGTGNGMSTCPRSNCSKTFTNALKKESLTQHILSSHMKLIPETLTHQCPVCKVVLKSRHGLGQLLIGVLRDHYDIHHYSDNMEEGATMVNCDQLDCSAYFKNVLQLDVHKCSVHGLREERFECSDCQKTFTFRNRYNRHRRRVHLKMEELAHHCSYVGCKSRFETERELKCHVIYSHKGKGATPMQCNICGKTVKGKAALRFHMVIHEPKDNVKSVPKNNKSMVVCDICGKECKHNAELQSHQLSTHFPDKWTFQCNLCPKKCMNQQRLDVHMRMHTQEKPFVCDICGLKYAHKHNLKIHVNSSHKKKGKKLDLVKT